MFKLVAERYVHLLPIAVRHGALSPVQRRIVAADHITSTVVSDPLHPAHSSWFAAYLDSLNLSHRRFFPGVRLSLRKAPSEPDLRDSAVKRFDLRRVEIDLVFTPDDVQPPALCLHRGCYGQENRDDSDPAIQHLSNIRRQLASRQRGGSEAGVRRFSFRSMPSDAEGWRFLAAGLLARAEIEPRAT
jgi:hypothetical protein